MTESSCASHHPSGKNDRCIQNVTFSSLPPHGVFGVQMQVAKKSLHPRARLDMIRQWGGFDTCKRNREGTLGRSLVSIVYIALCTPPQAVSRVRQFPRARPCAFHWFHATWSSAASRELWVMDDCTSCIAGVFPLALSPTGSGPCDQWYSVRCRLHREYGVHTLETNLIFKKEHMLHDIYGHRSST